MTTVKLNNLYLKIEPHFGHRIVIAKYGGDENIAVECMDCYEIIVDADRLDYIDEE